MNNSLCKANESHEQTAWLVERVSQPPAWIGCLSGCPGKLMWVTASNAIRLARAVDAERLALSIGLPPDSFQITEHAWISQEANR